MDNPYSKYTTGIYENLDAYQRATTRAKTDPIGEGEKRSLAGTTVWIEARKAKLAALHVWELKELDKFSNQAMLKDDLLQKHTEQNRKLDAENAKETWEYKLKIAETYTQTLGSLFNNLYTAYGKQSKSLFLLSKTASIATIVVKTAQGIMSALGEKNWPMAILIAAEGSSQMAVASAATMARGGLVPGYSPSKTADNIPLRGTAGEFMHPVDSVNYYSPEVHEAMRQKLIPRELFSGLNLPNAPAPVGSSLAGGGLVGGTGKANFTILNYVDRQELLRALATPEGKDAVFNLLSSNPVALRRIMRG